MLRRVEIKNYKAFKAFEIDLGARNLLIGPNNAGKTTLVSILRLIAHLTRPGQLRGFEPVAQRSTGVSIDLEALDIPSANLAHNRTISPSRIAAYFDEGLDLRITLVAGGRCYATWHYERGELVRAEPVRRMLGTSLGAVPPVGPVEIEEQLLTERYVKAQADGRLSQYHFRNQWFHGLFEQRPFLELLEQTLPGIQVFQPKPTMMPGKTLLNEPPRV